jgi:hypothetical protein
MEAARRAGRKLANRKTEVLREAFEAETSPALPRYVGDEGNISERADRGLTCFSGRFPASHAVCGRHLEMDLNLFFQFGLAAKELKQVHASPLSGHELFDGGKLFASIYSVLKALAGQWKPHAGPV